MRNTVLAYERKKHNCFVKRGVPRGSVKVWFDKNCWVINGKAGFDIKSQV